MLTNISGVPEEAASVLNNPMYSSRSRSKILSLLIFKVKSLNLPQAVLGFLSQPFLLITAPDLMPSELATHAEHKAKEL